MLRSLVPVLAIQPSFRRWEYTFLSPLLLAVRLMINMRQSTDHTFLQQIKSPAHTLHRLHRILVLPLAFVPKYLTSHNYCMQSALPFRLLEQRRWTDEVMTMMILMIASCGVHRMGSGSWSTRRRRPEGPPPTSPGRPAAAAAGRPTRWTPQSSGSSPRPTASQGQPRRSTATKQRDKDSDTYLEDYTCSSASLQPDE
jgi:hypothetical protein